MNKKIYLILLLIFTSSFIFAQTTLSVAEEKSSNEINASDFSGSVQIALSNADYMVTAGDVYSLTYVANGTPISYTIPVDPSYKIRVANLAVLDASGRSYISLKKQVEEIVQKNYPMSGVQFVLLNPASFKVVITGEVKKTAERNAWALTRLSSVINGLTTNYSSTRNISIISTNGTKKTYDLFMAERLGDLSQNPYVRPGDIITIGRIERKVTISGAVERPGTYELLEGENLRDLINIYGKGATVQADFSRVELTKIIDVESKTGQKFYLTEEQAKSNYVLSSYDSVYINSYSSLKPVMFVEGAIQSTENMNLEASNKIPVQFEPGTKYSQFVMNHRTWFRSTSDIENAYILRNDKVIPLNVYKILYESDFYVDEELKENDILRIPYIQNFVTVSGSVKNPGRYPYIPDRTYEYYIGLAGGFIKGQNAFSSVEIKDINGTKVKKSAVITPESNIIAKTNAFSYYFNQYAPIVTTVLNIVLTTVTVQNYLKTMQTN